MAFPASFLEELSVRNPIDDVVSQYVTLKRKGSNLFGLCPFHSEKTGSFSVSPDKGIYYCFGCHKGGGVINFIMEIENLDYPDAVRFLAKRANLEVPEDEGFRSTYKKQERLWALCKEAARFYRAQLLSPVGEAARAYIQKRGLSAQTVTRFGLGFAPDAWSSLLDEMRRKGFTQQELQEAGLTVRGKNSGTYDRFRNRLMFPIIDVRGNVIGFGGRVMDDSEPKYLNSPETVIFNKRKNLFGLNFAKKSKQGLFILTEGYMDTITLHQYGFDCAVASLGTALTEEHANILGKYTDQVVLTYDSDAAGQNATQRAIPMLEKAGLKVKVLQMQGAKDPDEYLKKYGAARFSNLLEQSENQAEYRLQALQRQYDLTLDEQRVEFLRQAAELVSTFSTAPEREVYGRRAANAAGVSYEAFKLEADRAYRKRTARARKKQEAISLEPVRLQQPQVKSIRYDNVRSAVAEEGLLRLILLEPQLLSKVPFGAEHFSSELLGRVFSAFCEQQANGQTVSLTTLGEAFSKEEMTHLSSVFLKQDVLLSEDALHDYIATISKEYDLKHQKGPEGLLAIAARKKDTKGYGGET